MRTTTICATEAAGKKVCAGRDLADALAKTKLSVEDARAWSRDLRNARKTPKAPTRKW